MTAPDGHGLPLAGRTAGWRAVASLAAFAAVAGLAVGITRDLTRERIAANEAARVLAELTAVLPPGLYDNEPHRDIRLLATGGGEALPVYRARLGGEPSAAVLTVVAADGYVGPIHMLVGITADGRILGVRVTRHAETPGIGDAIDARRSDWIGRLTGRSLSDPAPERWRLSRDGGDFDAIAGATISSRAVVNASREALVFMATHRDEVFAP
ncbi:MAG: RnfABCDGE type electron transport complex subunit G [Gammaproteobacteria bacterium]|nr:RnfABCDGE type electron transport complex subunit G [Gammaproteobacteria bacterium]